MPTNIEGGLYYTALEAAGEIGISERQMRTFISEGKIKTINVNGRFMVHESDLSSFKETYVKWEKPR